MFVGGRVILGFKSARILSRVCFSRAECDFDLRSSSCSLRPLSCGFGTSGGMRQAPDKPEDLRIEFSKGVPVKVCYFFLNAAATLTYCLY